MGGLETGPILEQLRSATASTEQVAALRALKNDVVGHNQKKEAWVAAGVLEPMVKILATFPAPGKRKGKATRSHPSSPDAAEEESVKLQAIQALSTFGNGGPPFLAPIRASGAIEAILGNISPSTNSPQTVHASLRALTVLADSAASTGSGSASDLQALADSLFVPTHIQSIQTILASSSPDDTTQSQISLIAGLIGRLCRDDSHRHALAKPNGVLDALATRLASFVVASGLVLPGAERLLKGDNVDRIPEPAPRSAKLAPILRAIGTIVSGSKYSAFVLLTSPAILSVFPTLQPHPAPAMRGAWQPTERSSHDERLSAMDCLLPAVPSQRGSRRAGQKSGEPRDKPIPGMSVQASVPQFNGRIHEGNGETDEPESPLIPYLIHLSRSSDDDMVRLMAIAVLVPLIKAGFAAKSVREPLLVLFVVPTLLQLVRDHLDKQCQSDASPSVAEPTRESWEILERAPELLNRLILDNEPLQRAAFECGASETLARLLQEAYKPAVTTQPRMWSAHADTMMDTDEGPASRRLGQAGALPLLLHRIRLRESALKGIHAVAAKDEYCKSIAELDTMPCIVESLLQYPGKPQPAKERQLDKPSEVTEPGYGENPSSVIIAACHVVRMLSRAISVLRTVLVDFGVWVPILRFLRHPDVQVQIAAAAVMVNLVTQVSPMKEPLIEQNVMKVLCELTRSSNASLRLNALWSLKHLVLGATPATKKLCLEELEPGLLVRLICDDTEDRALLSSGAGSESPAADVDDTMEEDTDMQQSEEQMGFDFSAGAEEDASGRGRTRQMDDRLSGYRESEVNPVQKARGDDLAIQEQGLNFIRNLIMGEQGDPSRQDGTTESTQMIDYLFSELGQDRFLSILEAKLRPKVTRPFSRRGSGGESRVAYPQPKIVEAVTYILVHMAASAPRHRQLVIAQTNMLKQLGTYFSSKDAEVRVALCHLVSNLTWQDNAVDAPGCQQRAEELRNLGFLGRVESLREGDGELNVRERAKDALFSMGQSH